MYMYPDIEGGYKSSYILAGLSGLQWLKYQSAPPPPYYDGVWQESVVN